MMVMIVIAAAVTIMMMELPCLFCFKLGFKLKIIHHNGTVFCIAVDALHAVITYFVGIQVASVALAAADALFFFKNTLFLQSHFNHLLQEL
ncbi:MAG: hypothetical protein IJ392_05975 [Clostridia bacterium]|nr:hypothetical protein [Clostridia bacterium]